MSNHRKLDNHCPDCGKEIDDRSTYCSPCSRIGKRNGKYKHGLEDLSRPQYRGRTIDIIDYSIWVKDVFERDNYCCQHCDSNHKLRAHHIHSFAKYPELRLTTTNGITFCEYHHKQLHQLFGSDVTPEQLRWFFNNAK